MYVKLAHHIAECGNIHFVGLRQIFQNTSHMRRHIKQMAPGMVIEMVPFHRAVRRSVYGITRDKRLGFKD